jgi:hypothetical protein
MKNLLCVATLALLLGISPLAYIMIIEQAFAHEAIGQDSYLAALGLHRWLSAPGDFLCGPDFDLSDLSSSHLVGKDFWWYMVAHLILNTLGWFAIGLAILTAARRIRRRKGATPTRSGME